MDQDHAIVENDEDGDDPNGDETATDSASEGKSADTTDGE
jgi:hypothetical protein